MSSAAELATHRGSSVIEAQDILFPLGRQRMLDTFFLTFLLFHSSLKNKIMIWAWLISWKLKTDRELPSLVIVN